MKEATPHLRAIAGLSLLAGLVVFQPVFAQDTLVLPVNTATDAATAQEINSLNQTIQTQKRTISNLQSKIDSYQSHINEQHQKKASLAGELDLLDNRIAKTELAVLENRAQLDLVDTEIRLLETELQALEADLDRDKRALKEVLQSIQVNDQDLTLQLVFGTDSFSDLFDALEHLENVQSDLQDAVLRTQDAKQAVVSTRDSERQKRSRLAELSEQLKTQQTLLESEVGAKEKLYVAARNSEAQFQALLEEVKQEEAYIEQQVRALQEQIEERIRAQDEVGDSSVLSWPVPASRGISATFHDPTYPFRHLFEHSGIDLPESTGTPVRAAAPGYVAFARVGRMYGNYAMIIHSGGLATLYGHMHTMQVSTDQFVTRGQQIGTVGSTGFSTGPHLHFEVRKNGIPTNPLNYLIAK